MKRFIWIGVILLLFLVAAQCSFELQPQPSVTSTEAADFIFSPEWQERQKLIPVALGEEPADLVVVNGKTFIAQTGEFLEDWVVATKGRRIAYAGPADEIPKSAPGSTMMDTLIGPDTIIIDATGQTLVPGFGHSHIHVESSRLSPPRFAEVVLPHGTTWLVEGDHEIGNVLGERGVTFWLDMQPRYLKIFPAVTSAVPPSDEVMEPTGGWFGYQVVRSLFKQDNRIRSVGEVMYEPGIQNPSMLGYNRLHQVLQAGWDAREAIQGHTGGNDYSNISTFRNVAIRSNHNPRGAADTPNDHIVRVARLGMWTDHSSNRANFDAVTQGVYASGAPYAAAYVTLSTDDRDLPETFEDGDMDHNVREYIRAGWQAIDDGITDVSKAQIVIDALRASSYNAAQLLHLDDEVGSFSPGAFADILLLNGRTVDEIAAINIDRVIASGSLVVEGGELIEGIEPVQEPPDYTLSTVALRREVVPDDFVVTAPEGKKTVEAWLWKPFDFRPRPDTVTLPVVDGIVQYGADLGVYKMAAIERHLSLGPNPANEIQLGIMFSAASPSHPCSAVATTVMHDAHQLTVHGSCDSAMALAANRLNEIGGGFVVVADDEVLAEVALPIAGLMSNEDPVVLLDQFESMRAASDSLEWVGVSGGAHPTDRMTFWFLTPAPWPWNLTTRGFFDLFTGEQLPIVW